MTEKYFANKQIYVPNYEQAIKESPYLNEAYEFGLTKGKKQGAVDFGFWLVNAPNKEIHKKSWIEIKYSQYLKEKEGLVKQK